MKNIAKYLKYYIKESILGPLFKLFEATLELIVPLVIAAIIDVGIENRDLNYIIKMSLLLVLLGIVGLAFSVIAQFYAAKASVGYITRLKSALFAHMQSLSYADIDRVGTSTMITRMTADATKVQTGLNLTLRLLLRSPFVVFGAMIMAFSIDYSAGASFAIVIPILSIIIFGIMLITTPMYKKVQAGVDKILLKTKENLSGVRVIRAFGKEDEEISDFRKENEQLTSSQKYAGQASALMNPLTYVVINLGIIMLIYGGAIQVDRGELTQGEVIALYNYMSQILIELIKLANLIISITKAIASASRISSTFDVQPSQAWGERTEGKAGDYAVEFVGVSKKYDSASENSIENITFKARRGETIGVIGGTGSGKTTLINLIPRFYDATDGEIKINGYPIKEYSKSALNSKIGIVPQKAVLFSGTIRDNMKWGNENASDDDILSALRLAMAEDFVNEKGGLDAEVAAGGKNFSGGQRQRLTIARALVAKPEILILDDSSSALDYATDAKLRMGLRQSYEPKTVFIVSQRAASVMHSDKIIVLDDGHAAGLGTHDNLLETCAVYREIYDSQFKKEAQNGN